MLALVCPFVTLIGHVRQQQLQHHLLAFLGAQTLAQDLETWRDIAAATGRKRSFAFDFNHTRTAIAIRAQSFLVAKVRNVNAMAFGCVQNRLALETHHGLLIELELNTGWCQQFLRQWRVHSSHLLWKIFLNTAHRVRSGLSQTTNGGIGHHLIQVI